VQVFTKLKPQNKAGAKEKIALSIPLGKLLKLRKKRGEHGMVGSYRKTKAVVYASSDWGGGRGGGIYTPKNKRVLPKECSRGKK